MWILWWILDQFHAKRYIKGVCGWCNCRFGKLLLYSKLCIWYLHVEGQMRQIR